MSIIKKSEAIVKTKDGLGTLEKTTSKMEFCPEGADDTIRITVTKEYNFKLSDRITNSLPDNCFNCPVGFSTVEGNPCGRNVPWTEVDRTERPCTCKLRKLEDYLDLDN